MDDLASALRDAGGARAPRERAGQLRTLLAAELAHGRCELGSRAPGASGRCSWRSPRTAGTCSP